MQCHGKDLLTDVPGTGFGLFNGSTKTSHERDGLGSLYAVPSLHTEARHQFLYNNAGPYLAGILVQRRSGCDLVNYLMPRLFEPMGIRRPVWETDPYGYTFGAGGLFLCVTELLKFGQLLLQEGNWEGKQIVPSAYIREASKKYIDNEKDGYGYLFWRGPYNSYRADGKYGQFSIVLPDKNAVIAINAESRDADAMMECCMDIIVPQL